MPILRNAHRLARLVLVWFALSIGVAVASPMVHPKGMDLVCTGSGGMQLVVADDDGQGPAVKGHTLDCPLCMMASAPPSVALSFEVFSPLAYVPQALLAARIAVATAPPLPPRGPPSSLL